MLTENGKIGFLNVRLGKTVEDIELEVFKKLIFNALVSYKKDFTERDYLHVYITWDRMGLVIQNYKRESDKGLIISQKIGAFYGSSEASRRSFYRILLS